MRLLALDTATQRGSIAVVDGVTLERCVWLGDGRAPRGNDALAPAVDALVGGELDRLDGIALSIGPGSFTGLRIALSFIKGLVIATPKPVAVVSTLEAFAFLAAGALPVLAVIDARNGEVFARFESVLPEGLYRLETVVTALAGRPTGVIAGEPPPALLAALPGWHRPAAPDPLAPAIAHLASSRFRLGNVADVLDLQPSYGQPAAADRPRTAVDTPAS